MHKESKYVSTSFREAGKLLEKLIKKNQKIKNMHHQVLKAPNQKSNFRIP